MNAINHIAGAVGRTRGQTELAPGSALRRSIFGAWRAWISWTHEGIIPLWNPNPIERANAFAAAGYKVIATITPSPDDIQRGRTFARLNLDQIAAQVARLQPSIDITFGNEINDRRKFTFTDPLDLYRNFIRPMAERIRRDQPNRRLGSPCRDGSPAPHVIREWYLQHAEIYEFPWDFHAANLYARSAHEFEGGMLAHAAEADRRERPLGATEYNLRHVDDATHEREFPAVARCVVAHTQWACYYPANDSISVDPATLGLWRNVAREDASPAELDTAATEAIEPRYTRVNRALARAMGRQWGEPEPPVVVEPTPVRTFDQFRASLNHAEKRVILHPSAPTFDVPASQFAAATITHTRERTGTPHTVFRLVSPETTVIDGWRLEWRNNNHRELTWFEIAATSIGAQIRNCVAVNAGTFALIRGTGSVIESCVVERLRMFGVMVDGGKDTRLIDLTIGNSIDEHCMRAINGWRNLRIERCNLTQRAGEMPHDTIKGCLTLEDGDDATVIAVTANGGPISVRPPDWSPRENAAKRTRNVRLIGCRVVGHIIGVGHGVETLLAEACEADEFRVLDRSAEFARNAKDITVRLPAKFARGIFVGAGNDPVRVETVQLLQPGTHQIQ